MKIYYTRHGQTVWNAENRICGVSDIPLTEKGMAQAQALAEKVAAMQDVDIILSSPLTRARESAGVISAKTGKPVIVNDRLTEWDYGKYEGIDRHSTYEAGKPMFQDAKLEFGIRIGESGESLLQLAHRIYGAIDDIKEKYSDKNVLIVTHGGVCRMIETYFKDMTTSEYSQYFLSHCALKCWDAKSPHVITTI